VEEFRKLGVGDIIERVGGSERYLVMQGEADGRSFVRFDPRLEAARVRTGGWGSDPGDMFGLFLIDGPCGRELRIIASSGDEELQIFWEHVSVSLPNRCPNWPEMSFVKDLFWNEEETVMQLHPPKSQWINNHPFCLHLWRPLNAEIPLPPSETVGTKELNGLAGRGAEVRR